MRVVGLLLLAGGGAAVAYAVGAMYRVGRPRDVLLGIAAPLAMLLALLGLVLMFVPAFLSPS